MVVSFSSSTNTKKYFYKFQGEWQLYAQVKALVKFKNINLVKDNFPSDIDLILCRNVFVYFDEKYISLVIKKFYNSLNKGGYLITGHAELYGQSLSQFMVKVFPESLVYQRIQDGKHENYLFDSLPILEENITSINKSFKSASINSIREHKASIFSGIYDSVDEKIYFDLQPKLCQDQKKKIATEISENKINQPSSYDKILLEAEALFEHKAYGDAIQKAEQFISLNPKSLRAYQLLAQLYANLGRYDYATFYCNRAIEINYLSISPYYLLVSIAEEYLERTKILLKRIIYLFPLEIPAYIELSSLYAAEKDMTRAKKTKNIALELLKKLPRDTKIEYKKIKVSELIDYLERD